MQWWYGHNAVAFFLTTPFLGLMYYFLPKAADRPVFSYRLSILHFWTLVFIYIWAGPHHLHYTALPAWASTLGMLFSVMLWMPSWGGMINGLLTLRGAWHKVAEDPILKFFVVAITFYGMSTFEGPLMSIKTVNMLSHYTDWGIAHVHAGGLGWVGFMVFGMLYWLAPRLFQAEIFNPGLRTVHFWMGTLGILLYIIPIYVAGITQGLMWSQMNSEGGITYDFIETTTKLAPMYYVRVLGGLLYFSGAVLCLYNVVMTWAKSRPKEYDVAVQSALPLSRDYIDPPLPASQLRESGGHFPALAYKLEHFFTANWHRRWERLGLFFTVMVVIAVVTASLFEMIPTFLIKSNVPTIAAVKPYTPLELAGRDIYLSNGCYNCHSQMVRPLYAETSATGSTAKAGEFVYDHPFQWGSRRIGPDLHRLAGKFPDTWHLEHMVFPQDPVEQSIMPPYRFLADQVIDFEDIQNTVNAMVTLGVPYGEEIERAPEMARAQAQAIAAGLEEYRQGLNLKYQQSGAMIAYLPAAGHRI